MRSATLRLGQSWEKRFDRTPQSVRNKRGNHVVSPPKSNRMPKQATALQGSFCYSVDCASGAVAGTNNLAKPSC